MDVGIVGGGLVGVALAVALRERGARVTLFERGMLGGEASSGAGGMFGAQIESHPGAPPGALSLAELVAARTEALAWALDLERETPVGLSRQGILKLAFDETELHDATKLAAAQRAEGARAELLSGPQARELVRAVSPRAIGALYFPDDAHVDPPRYLAAAVHRARALGATLHEHVAVHAVGSAWIEHAERQEFDRVVVAAGSWSSQLLPEPVAPLVKPIRGQMIELRVPLRPFGPVLFGAGTYAIPRDDGRITVGSTMEDVGHVRAVDAAASEMLRGGAVQSAPMLEHAEQVRAWTAFRPFSPDGLLARETTLAGVWVLSGHHRNGILLARHTAVDLAARLLG